MVFTTERVIAAVIVAGIYALVVRKGGDEARASVGVVAWANALLIAVAVVIIGVALYAQDATPNNTYQPPCDVLWWLGLPWCWWW